MSLRNLESLKNHNKQMHKKEWAKPFLANWNRAVELWDSGKLFQTGDGEGALYRRERYKGYTVGQVKNQQEYARICCAWLIPNGFKEPHCVAQGE